MYIVNRTILARSVIWANKNVYYDKPNVQPKNRKSMFLVTMVNDDYFFGSPLTINDSIRNRTVLRKELYPIKQDSKITENLYKLTYNDIVNNKCFMITEGTFERFIRTLYQRIAIGQMDGPEEYNQTFASYYLKNHKPKVNDIIAYPSDEKKFKYYYVLDEDDDNYQLLKLNKIDLYNFIIDNSIVNMSKNVMFYDYYSGYTINGNILSRNKKESNPILMKK